MYLALFLTPWIAVYAFSTIVMNHREFFQPRDQPRPVAWTKTAETTYGGSFAEATPPSAVGRQILADLGKDGFFEARYSKENGRITILRQHAFEPERITYSPADGALVIEKQPFRAVTFLERMHRRRGYSEGFAVQNTWAFSVDLVIAALVFWVLSGIWMWWELKATRRLGLLCAASGIALFGVFLAVL